MVILLSSHSYQRGKTFRLGCKFSQEMKLSVDKGLNQEREIQGKGQDQESRQELSLRKK